MRIIPLPPDLILAEGQERVLLGPPEGMESKDCATVEVLRSHEVLPSGQKSASVSAMVFVSAAELEEVIESGGLFWVGFLGTTFPPVYFEPVNITPPRVCAVCATDEGDLHTITYDSRCKPVCGESGCQEQALRELRAAR